MPATLVTPCQSPKQLPASSPSAPCWINMTLVTSWSLNAIPWIMGSNIRWLRWILPSALVSEGVVLIAMETCSRAQKHNEINKMAHQQTQRNSRTAWRCMRGLVQAPPLPNPGLEVHYEKREGVHGVLVCDNKNKNKWTPVCGQ